MIVGKGEVTFKMNVRNNLRCKHQFVLKHWEHKMTSCSITFRCEYYPQLSSLMLFFACLESLLEIEAE